jgi:predicted hydrocarbon binding protein
METTLSKWNVNSICLEWLNVGVVRYFREVYGENSSNLIEKIGYNVGYRLTER